MKLISVENYQLKVADEALLVRPIRRLWNMDRTKGKETFYKQMSVLFYTYDPRSNYSYILDEKERMKEVLVQEGIKDFHEIREFKDAVEAYKKLCITPSSQLLNDVKITIDRMRAALTSINFDVLDEKDKAQAIKTVASVVAMIPKLVKDLADAENAINKEMAEQGKARGSQQLTIMDNEFE